MYSWKKKKELLPRNVVVPILIYSVCKVLHAHYKQLKALSRNGQRGYAKEQASSDEIVRSSVSTFSRGVRPSILMP